MKKEMQLTIERIIKEEVEKSNDNLRIENIKNIMDTLKLTPQQAMDALRIPAEKQKKYSQMI